MFGSTDQHLDQPSGPGQTARALLVDHLDAALAHCEALGTASTPLGESLAGGSTGRALLRQDRAIAQFVNDLRTREMAIGLRLTRAVTLAAAVADHDRSARSIALLVRSGSSMLIDAAEHAARQVHDGAEDAGDIAYLVGRGVLSDTVCTLPAEGSLSTGDTFLVLGVVPLADVQAFLHRALEALA